jgi:glycerophosphoryl diester phosphodiesterase
MRARAMRRFASSRRPALPRVRTRSLVLCCLAAWAAAIAVPTAGAVGPEIHAHRGGSVVDGVPTFAEETLPAFRHAWAREQAVLELDVKLTADRVPVVIHDDTLDRTTTCTGLVSAITAAAFKACRGDVLGSGGTTARTSQTVELATLAEVLAFARDSGASVNLELKNVPTDEDFDATSAYTDTVMDVVVASGFPLARLIVQSFWPPNLDAAAARVPGVTLSFLTLTTEGGIELARARGYAWISPGGVPSLTYVRRAHELGVKVVPYTLNTPEAVRAAASAGVDALITDDPVMARRALGRPLPSPGPAARPAPQPGPGSDDLRLTLVPRRLSTARRRHGVVAQLHGGPATVTLRLSRGGRTLVRRTVRARRRSSRIRLPVRPASLAGRRATLRLTAVAATPAGRVVRLRATRRLRR